MTAEHDWLIRLLFNTENDQISLNTDTPKHKWKLSDALVRRRAAVQSFVTHSVRQDNQNYLLLNVMLIVSQVQAQLSNMKTYPICLSFKVFNMA